MLPTKFKSIGLSIQDKKREIGFQDGGHLGYPIKSILATFNLQVTSMNPSKFRVGWSFGSGEEAKNKCNFQNAAMAAILDFRSEQFLALCDLQVTPMLPTKFQVN